MKVQDIPEIAELSIPEKILFVEDLWENIVADNSPIPIPQSHINELEQRNRRYLSNPGSLLTLDQLQSNIEAGK